MMKKVDYLNVSSHSWDSSRGSSENVKWKKKKNHSGHRVVTLHQCKHPKRNDGRYARQRQRTCFVFWNLIRVHNGLKQLHREARHFSWPCWLFHQLSNQRMSVVGCHISIINGLFSQTIGHVQGEASGDQPCVGKAAERAAGDLLPADAACCGGVGRFPVQPWWRLWRSGCCLHSLLLSYISLKRFLMYRKLFETVLSFSAGMNSQLTDKLTDSFSNVWALSVL